MIYILGIESTCDETAAAIINEKKEIISHVLISQSLEHSEFGGVVPEIASRRHLENISPLMNLLFKDAKDPETGEALSIHDMSGVACAVKPGLIGGLLVGANFAKAICDCLEKPFIPVDHLDAHLLMPFMFFDEIQFPNLALLISGGHCQSFIIKDLQNFEKIGGTIDDSVGEAFDKTAQMLSLAYPGGPNIEKLARSGDRFRFKFPKPLIGGKFNSENNENLLNFSFSGLKTAVRILIQNLKNELGSEIDQQTKADICASFQQTISEILIIKIENCLKRFPEINEIVISGGVASNLFLRSEFSKAFPEKKFYYPPVKFCTDNGVMIAFAGLIQFLSSIKKFH